MNFEELSAEILNNYRQKHKDILQDTTVNSQVHAERILAKYDTKYLTKEQIEFLKGVIISREVEDFLAFTSENEDILNSNFTFQKKLKILLEKYDKGLSSKEREELKGKISRHIFDHETAKILGDLAIKLKDLKDDGSAE